MCNTKSISPKASVPLVVISGVLHQELVHRLGVLPGVLHNTALTTYEYVGADEFLKQYIEDREFAFYLEKTEKTLPFDEFLHPGPRFQGLILL